jgi:hypothetical protein
MWPKVVYLHGKLSHNFYAVRNLSVPQLRDYLEFGARSQRIWFCMCVNITGLLSQIEKQAHPVYVFGVLLYTGQFLVWILEKLFCLVLSML